MLMPMAKATNTGGDGDDLCAVTGLGMMFGKRLGASQCETSCPPPKMAGRLRKPAKRAPTARMINGTVITAGGSWAWS